MSISFVWYPRSMLLIIVYIAYFVKELKTDNKFNREEL